MNWAWRSKGAHAVQTRLSPDDVLGPRALGSFIRSGQDWPPCAAEIPPRSFDGGPEARTVVRWCCLRMTEVVWDTEAGRVVEYRVGLSFAWGHIVNANLHSARRLGLQPCYCVSRTFFVMFAPGGCIG
jgi:hypothetical protein